MMNIFQVLWMFTAFGCATVFSATSTPDPRTVVVLKWESEPHNGDGKYYFNYEQSDRQTREESGILKAIENDKEPAVVVKGSYSYVDPDGRLIVVTYEADEKGFRPKFQKSTNGVPPPQIGGLKPRNPVYPGPGQGGLGPLDNGQPLPPIPYA